MSPLRRIVDVLEYALPRRETEIDQDGVGRLFLRRLMLLRLLTLYDRQIVTFNRSFSNLFVWRNSLITYRIGRRVRNPLTPISMI